MPLGNIVKAIFVFCPYTDSKLIFPPKTSKYFLLIVSPRPIPFGLEVFLLSITPKS
ncbi:unnamed protein product [Moneuplotes crassus]|uniref:Uncharacterized protein n=1 Tax=Euplotes crassus TaxID=5936 RepID=A0AAD1XYA7_EUPCR|nr:unnamed protein product [Moneuplotes crassus]